MRFRLKPNLNTLSCHGNIGLVVVNLYKRSPSRILIYTSSIRTTSVMCVSTCYSHLRWYTVVLLGQLACYIHKKTN